MVRTVLRKLVSLSSLLNNYMSVLLITSKELRLEQPIICHYYCAPTIDMFRLCLSSQIATPQAILNIVLCQGSQAD